MQSYNESSYNIPIPSVLTSDPVIIPTLQTGSWWIDFEMTYKDRHNKIINDLKTNNTDIILIGDSLTHYWEPNTFVVENGFKTWQMLDNKYKIKNLGFAGDETEHVLWRIHNGEISKTIKPKLVILLIGTNNSGLSGHKPKSIAAGIGAIIKYIHAVLPCTKIILLSLLPRGKTMQDPFRINNNAVNEIIKSYNGYMNVKYYCIKNKFLLCNENIKTEYFTDDYLHLSVEGYELLGNLFVGIFDKELAY